MLASISALVLAAGPTFSVSATGGGSITTNGSGGSDPATVRIAPLFAFSAAATQVTPVGIARARFSFLLPGGITEDLGSFVECERPFINGSWRIRFEPFAPNQRLVTFDWANAVGRLFPSLTGFAPVVSSSVQVGAFDAFFSLRPSLRLDPVSMLNVGYVDPLVGARISLSGWAFEARFGRMSYGQSALLRLQGRTDAELWGLVGAGRVSWMTGGGVEAPLDLVTSRSDPTRFDRLFDLAPWSTPFAMSVLVEGGGGTQRLADVSRFAETAMQPLGYADAQLRLRVRDTRLFATFRLATAGFVQADAPGLPPFAAISGTHSPMLTGFLGAEHTFSTLGLTPGLLVRVSRSAFIGTEGFDFGGNAPPPGFTGPRTFIIPSLSTFLILPPGSQVKPDVTLKFTLRWAPVKAFSVLGQFDVVFDENGTPVVTPRQTQLQLFLQGRF